MSGRFVWLVRSESKVIGRNTMGLIGDAELARPFSAKSPATAAMNWAKRQWPSESWSVVKYELVEVPE